MSERPDAASGEKPSPMRIAAVTATGVPKPDAPSKKRAERKGDQQQLDAPVRAHPADRLLQRLDRAAGEGQPVHEEDVEHDPADREETDDRAEHGRTNRQPAR